MNTETIIDAFKLAMLQNDESAASIIDACQQQPDDFLLNCYTASLYLYAQTDEGTAKAKAHLLHAEKQLSPLSKPERLLLAALRAWSDLYYDEAIDGFRRLLEHDPMDLLPLKYAEWLFYVIGQQYAAQRFCDLCASIEKHHAENPYFLSVHSFALELNGQREQALQIALQALSLKSDLVWAQHSVAHAQLMMGRITEGIQSLQQYQADWQTTVATLKSHMHWHLALLYVANRDEQPAMQLFNNAIWRQDDCINTILVQQDSIMFLWRMEMAGMPQADYWPQLLGKAQPNLNQNHMAFNAVNYSYLCAKNNRQDLQEALVTSAKQRLASLDSKQKQVWQDVGLPLMQAVYCLGREQYAEAVTLLAPIIDEVYCIGGSDAEDELYQMAFCYALARSGQADIAAQRFADKLPHYQRAALRPCIVTSENE